LIAVFDPEAFTVASSINLAEGGASGSKFTLLPDDRINFKLERLVGKLSEMA